jgi:hypothetical protein
MENGAKMAKTVRIKALAFMPYTLCLLEYLFKS